MSYECGSCFKMWDGSEDFMTCETCNMSYDLKCTKMTSTIFTMVNKTPNLSWRCFNCKNSAFKQLTLQINDLQKTVADLSNAFLLMFSERKSDNDENFTTTPIPVEKKILKKKKKKMKKKQQIPARVISKSPLKQPKNTTQLLPINISATSGKRKSTDSPNPHGAKKVRPDLFITPHRPIIGLKNVNNIKPAIQRVIQFSETVPSSCEPLSATGTIAEPSTLFRPKLLAANSVATVFVSRCGRSSSTDDIILHALFGLKDCNIDLEIADFKCKDITPRKFADNGLSRSFKLSFPSVYLQNVTASSFWPTGISVRPFEYRQKNC